MIRPTTFSPLIVNVPVTGVTGTLTSGASPHPDRASGENSPQRIRRWADLNDARRTSPSPLLENRLTDGRVEPTGSSSPGRGGYLVMTIDGTTDSFPTLAA